MCTAMCEDSSRGGGGRRGAYFSFDEYEGVGEQRREQLWFHTSQYRNYGPLPRRIFFRGSVSLPEFASCVALRTTTSSSFPSPSSISSSS